MIGWDPIGLIPMAFDDLDFSNLTDCTQMVRGPTHRAGVVLDLVLTNVPELCRVAVGGAVDLIILMFSCCSTFLRSFP